MIFIASASREFANSVLNAYHYGTPWLMNASIGKGRSPRNASGNERALYRTGFGELLTAKSENHGEISLGPGFSESKN